MDTGRGLECGVEGSERDERGVALTSTGSWEDALAAARERGVLAPRHIVSDGDKAIESAIDMARMTGILRISCVSFTSGASASAT